MMQYHTNPCYYASNTLAQSFNCFTDLHLQKEYSRDFWSILLPPTFPPKHYFLFISWQGEYSTRNVLFPQQHTVNIIQGDPKIMSCWTPVEGLRGASLNSKMVTQEKSCGKTYISILIISITENISTITETHYGPLLTHKHSESWFFYLEVTMLNMQCLCLTIWKFYKFKKEISKLWASDRSWTSHLFNTLPILWR